MNDEGDTATHPPLRVERRDDGIAVLWIDTPQSRQNTLDRALIDSAARALESLDADRELTGVIFASAKPGSFVAGADIGMISDCATAADASELARTGQGIFGRIAGFRVPVVAAINGVCLGGGLELALACHARVAADDPSVSLGLPEVKLGLLPGSGGTQRLPRLIPLPVALDMMLTGRQQSARKAARLGLVDEVVPPSILIEVAVEAVRARAKGGAGRPRRRRLTRRASDWLMRGNPLGRALVLRQAARSVAAKTQGNYPAPSRILHCVGTGLGQGMALGLAAEADAFGELAMTPESRELVGIHFATTAMKKDRGVDDPAVEPWPVRRAGVLGAGLMGAGISYVTADRAGIPVRLKDVEAAGLSKGLAWVAERIEGRRRRRSITAFEATLARRRVMPTLDFSGFGRVDVVIEAVFEDLELKHRMVADVEENTPDHTLFASNTSSIPIAEIARGAARPANVIGMHYFSPVDRMPLLEVIAHVGTAPAAIATAVAIGRQQGKTPIVVKDGAGFYVNRVLAPYINEALHLLEAGVPIDRIDGALVRFGFPVGPFKLLDEVGIDISAHVAPILHEAFGARMAPVDTARRMIDDGRLGRKSGRGFYRYGGRRSGRQVDESVYRLLGVTADSSPAESEIVDRCVLPMLNEAVRCLDDGILRSARDGDIGAVFGIGFPPFRGGPFRYLDRRGPGVVLERLAAFEGEFGERYAAAPGLARRAYAGERFHPV